MLEERCRFDWYQATVPASVAMLEQLFDNRMPDDSQKEDGKAANSFKKALNWKSKETAEVYAGMMWGGVNPHPHVTGSGDSGERIAKLLRETFPDHRVARVDVAIDMRGDGLFDDLFRLLAQTSAKYSTLSGKRILGDSPDDGSTYYLGAPTSAIRVRLYEKGKQLYKLTGDPVWRMFFDWARLEIQVRPQKAFKSEAARMPPEAFWGCAAWTRDLARDCLALNPEPVTMKPTRIADHERAMRALAAQYGPTLLRDLARRNGDVTEWAQALLGRITPAESREAA